MVKIKNNDDLTKYLNNFDFSRSNELESVYFLVEYSVTNDNNDKIKVTEPIYFFKYKDSWFASPCSLMKYDTITDDKWKNCILTLYFGENTDTDYTPPTKKEMDTVLNYEQIFQRNNCHYEIINLQTLPFLPKEFNIIKSLSEVECLDLLINNED